MYEKSKILMNKGIFLQRKEPGYQYLQAIQISIDQYSILLGMFSATAYLLSR